MSHGFKKGIVIAVVSAASAAGIAQAGEAPPSVSDLPAAKLSLPGCKEAFSTLMQRQTIFVRMIMPTVSPNGQVTMPPPPSPEEIVRHSQKMGQALLNATKMCETPENEVNDAAGRAVNRELQKGLAGGTGGAKPNSP